MSPRIYYSFKLFPRELHQSLTRQSSAETHHIDSMPQGQRRAYGAKSVDNGPLINKTKELKQSNIAFHSTYIAGGENNISEKVKEKKVY